MPEIIVKLGDRIIHRYYFDKDMLSVGRARENDIVIENLSVSRNHLRIKKQDNKFIMTDMNSANGTIVNGVRVSKTELVHNDEITVGKHSMVFINADDESVDASQRSAPASVPIPSEGLVGILVVSKGKQAGQEFRVIKNENAIGRAGENDIRLHDWFVSKKHASITRQGDSFVLRDLDSWRGTTVNGNTVREYELKDGDEIVFGTTVLSFRRADAASLPALPAPPRLDPEEEIPAEDVMNTSDSVRLEGVSSPAAPTAPPRPASSAAIPKPTAAAVARQPLAKPQQDAQELQYATLSSEDLEILESEFDAHIGTAEEEEENRKAAWEMTEMEKMFESGSGDEGTFSLIESDVELTIEEEDFVGDYQAPSAFPEWDDLEEEVESLYGGAMTDREPFGEPEQQAVVVQPVSSAAVARPSDSGNFTDAVRREVEMWEKALKNKSVVIRKNAAKELRKLTGKDYDWTTEPSSN
jgi:pSer/pThr/pTyr-binding forkhead associated (FHA) protein